MGHGEAPATSRVAELPKAPRAWAAMRSAIAYAPPMTTRPRMSAARVRGLVTRGFPAAAIATWLAACGGTDDSIFGSASTASGTTTGTPGTGTGSGGAGHGGSGGTGHGGSGGTAQGGSGGAGHGGSGGCASDGDCKDAFDCTVDTCSGGLCTHVAGPSVGETACAAGQFCDVAKGCVVGVVCADTAQCVAQLGGDACKTDVLCDPKISVCTYQTLDKDHDGHPPAVCGGDDCDDSDPQSYPGAPELCDGKSNDCDQETDEGATCPGLFACSAGACACPPANACGGDCSDHATDPKHCGSCAHACPAGATCSGGACVCPGATKECAGACVDTLTDGQNCGGCGKACGVGGQCVNGACQCVAPLTLCGGQCVDTKTDEQNCGGCGAKCASTCQAGVCQACPTADLYLLQDESSSMSKAIGNTDRIGICRQGIGAFLGEAKSQGVGLGLGYHPLPFPPPPSCVTNDDCGGGGWCVDNACALGLGSSCLVSDYTVPAVGIAALPGVAPSLQTSLTNVKPGDGSSTPPPALEGALSYAKGFAVAHPSHRVGVVLIADGLPNICTQNKNSTADLVAIAAKYAAGSPKVVTYVVGITTEVPKWQWDEIATAGGSGSAFVAEGPPEVQAALGQIRDAAKACP